MLNYSPASENNKHPILAVLSDLLDKSQDVLEIGSGSGQHAIFFANRFPQLTWQTSELADAIQALALNIKRHAPANVPAPVTLDVCDHPWPVSRTSVIFSANTLHIMSDDEVREFFKGIGQVLIDGGYLSIYGPVKYGGAYTSDSNAVFDQWLKRRDPLSGIPEFETIDTLAEKQGLSLSDDFAMPANNQLLLFQRQTEKD